MHKNYFLFPHARGASSGKSVWPSHSIAKSIYDLQSIYKTNKLRTLVHDKISQNELNFAHWCMNRFRTLVHDKTTHTGACKEISHTGAWQWSVHDHVNTDNKLSIQCDFAYNANFDYLSPCEGADNEINRPMMVLTNLYCFALYSFNIWFAICTQYWYKSCIVFFTDSDIQKQDDKTTRRQTISDIITSNDAPTIFFLWEKGGACGCIDLFMIVNWDHIRFAIWIVRAMIRLKLRYWGIWETIREEENDRMYMTIKYEPISFLNDGRMWWHCNLN